ncbi:MAG: type III pantothenate kinase [Oscillospiraceae bacterium]|jgi:type III pantothenate kinase|nr:type III pantothenate kinase [Oscillospiraceae bacterium]
MLFAIDMGNSTITLGCLTEDRLLFMERLSTNASKTDLEYAIDFKNLFEINGIDVRSIRGSIVSSVVPQLTETVRRAVHKITGMDAMLVGPGVKTGLRILIDNPAQLGSDLVVDAVACLKEYEPPLAIIDMGTATTISVLNEDGCYIGGVILPGILTAVDSLVSRTAQLPRIGFGTPRRVIGTNTVESMKSGLNYGNAACIDGMLDRIEAELGSPVTAVATGGFAEGILPYCRRSIKYDPALLLKGLREIHEKNAEPSRAGEREQEG